VEVSELKEWSSGFDWFLLSLALLDIDNSLSSRSFGSVVEVNRKRSNVKPLISLSYLSLSNLQVTLDNVPIDRYLMTDSHLSLLEGILLSLSSPITEHEIKLLASIVGHEPLKDALDLVDKDQGPPLLFSPSFRSTEIDSSCPSPISSRKSSFTEWEESVSSCGE